MLNVGSKVIAITGASSGIGEATARLLAHKVYGLLSTAHGSTRSDRIRNPL